MRTASLAAVVVLAGCAAPASAKLDYYYRMDSLSYLATDIVLCDEVDEADDKVTISVVRVLKGSCVPGQQMEVPGYGRQLRQSARGPHPWPRIPLGRAVYFLTQKDGVWEGVKAGFKPIYNGEAYCYGQFYSNPGERCLARMAPENFTVSDTEPYGEKELLADLEIGLEKSKTLTGPVEIDPFSGGIIRSDYRPKKMAAELLWPVVGVAIGALIAVVLWWQLGRKTTPQKSE
jgi:hypothetical protein